jgi:hypothetical protein
MFMKPIIQVLSTSPDPNEDYVALQIGCTRCGNDHLVGTTMSGYVAWRKGLYIQDAMPDVPKKYREMFISGTCPECFTDMFGSSDDDDEAITL